MTKKTGRPTRDPGGVVSKLFPIRLTESERADYERAASKAGLTVSEWIRTRLAKAAVREAKQG